MRGLCKPWQNGGCSGWQISVWPNNGCRARHRSKGSIVWLMMLLPETQLPQHLLLLPPGCTPALQNFQCDPANLFWNDQQLIPRCISCDGENVGNTFAFGGNSSSSSSSIAHFVPFDSLHMSSAEKVNSSEVSTVRPFDQILLTSFKFS